MRNNCYSFHNSIESDLGLNVPFIKGQNIPVRNCYHFSTDGNAVDSIFMDDADFIRGMNRIYVVHRQFQIAILAFCLMDTHVHFILYGSFDECNRFVHEYVRRTSMYIQSRHGDYKKMETVPINHQTIDTDYYLKTAICYVLRNAPVGGLPFNSYDYPWSSGALYFRRSGYWNSPEWTDEESIHKNLTLGSKEARMVLGTRDRINENLQMIGSVIFPGEYVDYSLVEKIFKSCKGFNYFMGRTKEDEVESRGGAISNLSIPIQEIRQHKNEICNELFGDIHARSLSTAQRVKVAKMLRSRFNSSPKQTARVVGLVYDEVKDML